MGIVYFDYRLTQTIQPCVLCSIASSSSAGFHLGGGGVWVTVLCMEDMHLSGTCTHNQSGKKYKGWWVWGWIKGRSQQWLMRTQPTCTVVRTYTEFAGKGNCWWLTFEGVGVLLSSGDIHYVSVLFCVVCQCGTLAEWLE